MALMDQVLRWGPQVLALASLATPAASQTWPVSEHLKLVPGDGAAGDEFGVSVSRWGNRILVGASEKDLVGSDSGAAYVYRRDGDGWTLEQQLTPNDHATGMRFGCSVSLVGDHALVGARGDSHAGADSGSAYVFFREGSTWIQQAKLVAGVPKAGDAFGVCVALDTLVAERALIGARARAVSGHPEAGAAYVFLRSVTIWTEEEKLLSDFPSDWEQFGASVAIEGTILAVGARFDHVGGLADAGRVHVFEHESGSWTRKHRIHATDYAQGDAFGNGVVLEGSTMVVQSLHDESDAGSAYVFEYDAIQSQWIEDQKLVGSDTTAGDRFGSGLALSGDRLVVGAMSEDQAGADAGAAYLFDRSPGSWTEMGKFFGEDTAMGDELGCSVALQGTEIVVGAHLHDAGATDVGAAHVFQVGPGISFCFGDGGGTACPCGNEGGLGHGCVNSHGATGALLWATGSDSVSAGDLVLNGAYLGPNKPGLYFQGSSSVGGGSGVPFGDGLRCAGGLIRRLELVPSGGAGTSQTTIDIPAKGGALAGQTLAYQLWYRDPGGPCGQGFNLTNALMVTYTP